MESTIQLLVFELDERRYALPLRQVERVFRAVDITPLPEAPPVVMGVIDIHGDLVPVLNTRRRVGTAERPVGVNDQFILARTSRRTVAIAVDRARDVVTCPRETVINAKTILPQLKQLDGVAQLDGGLALIHDLDRFLSLDEDRILAQALTGQLDHAH